MTGMINDLIMNNLGASKYQSETAGLKSIEKDLAANNPRNEKLKEAAQQFESVFINQLLQVMDKTIERSEFMHGGQGEEAFRGLFYQEIAKDIATNSRTNFGLGKQVYEQLAKFN